MRKKSCLETHNRVLIASDWTMSGSFNDTNESKARLNTSLEEQLEANLVFVACIDEFVAPDFGLSHC